ncbi:hypothetical protein [Streptomyces violens]|uniref:hypothetical protein n=1 Tax=Streptomyces violens TaxID=66377 RepID=UPI0004BE7378|nr:hypothetical protein [Streptomyces violens]
MSDGEAFTHAAADTLVLAYGAHGECERQAADPTQFARSVLLAGPDDHQSPALLPRNPRLSY